MADTFDMDDAALDDLLNSTVTDDSNPDGYSEVNENGEIVESGSENVSPSGDIEAGQSEDDEEETHVDETLDEDEDPEDSLSTDEDEDDVDEDEEPGEDHETSDDNSEDDSEDDSEADEEPVAFQPLRADGKEYPIESMQELYTLASKGINADRKWTESAEGRKYSSTMKKHGLTMDDISLLVDIKQGDPGAIANLLKQHDIDPLDIDVDALDGAYQKKDHSTGDFELALDEVVERVKVKPRYQESVNLIMDTWDEASKDKFYEKPEILELLNNDMQVDANGFSMYDKVAPVAEKMKALETGPRKSDLDYYMLAGQKVISAYQRQNQSEAEKANGKQEAKNQKNKAIKKKKKAAGSSGGRSGAGKAVKEVTEMTDEELDAIIANG